MFEIIFLIFLSLYFIQSVLFIIGANKKFPKISEDELKTVSIVVAARNEESNILRCLESLDKLEYPEDKLEIILVDDFSNDRTGEIMDNFIQGKPRFKKIITKKEIGRLKGKTNALANGIEIAKGEIIMTTDADCAVPPTWAKTLASYYTDNVAIVNGLTAQESTSAFTGIQNLDFNYLLVVSSATINYNLPTSCMGNNMSFLKKAYLEIGGFEGLPFSITEDFNLLMGIHKLKKYKIIFPLDKGSFVISKACKDWTELYRQKKRWGIGGLKAPLHGFFIMATGFVTNICFLFSPFFFSGTVLSLMIFKIIIDFLFLYFVLQKFNYTHTLKYFFQFEIYFLLYVIVLPFITIFNPKVVWKERKY